ncbi:MAG: sulfotransferase [Armatimonadetes bacterium]|nr:sulfotransferase [Anaerolineae bacterium]
MSEGDSNSLSGKLAKAQRGLIRTQKHIWQRMNLDQSAPKTPLWVVGNQRSGTTMLMKVLEKSRHMRVFQEHSRSAFQDDWRLQPTEVIQGLIANSYAPTVVFKPLCDAHLTDQLLTTYPNSKAIWIYRSYTDVASSAVKKWGEHLKDVMRQITVGDWHALGWRGERLNPEVMALVKRLYSPELGVEESAALQWYLRNHFYFELGLDTNPNVLLIRYETLVADPSGEFQRIFAFTETPYDAEVIAEVSERSVGKGKWVSVNPELQQTLEGLLTQLDSKFFAEHPTHKA